jgi:acetyl-CoA acyltransferase
VTLLAETLRAMLARTDVDPASIDDVIAGCVAGRRPVAHIARTAVLAAGIPESVPGTAADRQCGSSHPAAHRVSPGGFGSVTVHHDRPELSRSARSRE